MDDQKLAAADDAVGDADDEAEAPEQTVPEAVSVTCDCGSSQKMGTLPAFGAREPKAYGSCIKLECKAMGVIIHHIWRAMLLFPGSVGHGANMTCETLHIALEHLESVHSCLPGTVYNQLDNCADNKCATVLAYMYDLRRRGCLRKVTARMLIVGHTHIDIDQWFGVFSRAVTRHEALSLPEHERVLKGAFAVEANAPGEIRFVDLLHDWDAFYKPVMDPILKGFSAPKCFKFKDDANGDGRMFYKDTMISKEDTSRGRCNLATSSDLAVLLRPRSRSASSWRRPRLRYVTKSSPRRRYDDDDHYCGSEPVTDPTCTPRYGSQS
jgi:hypothetical protein